MGPRQILVLGGLPEQGPEAARPVVLEPLPDEVLGAVGGLEGLAVPVVPLVLPPVDPEELLREVDEVPGVEVPDRLPDRPLGGLGVELGPAQDPLQGLAGHLGGEELLLGVAELLDELQEILAVVPGRRPVVAVEQLLPPGLLEVLVLDPQGTEDWIEAGRRLLDVQPELAVLGVELDPEPPAPSGIDHRLHGTVGGLPPIDPGPQPLLVPANPRRTVPDKHPPLVEVRDVGQDGLLLVDDLAGPAIRQPDRPVDAVLEGLALQEGLLLLGEGRSVILPVMGVQDLDPVLLVLDSPSSQALDGRPVDVPTLALDVIEGPEGHRLRCVGANTLHGARDGREGGRPLHGPHGEASHYGASTGLGSSGRRTRGASCR